jgi:hypothetical protein
MEVAGIEMNLGVSWRMHGLQIKRSWMSVVNQRMKKGF